MMRAGLIVVGLSTLTIMELGTPRHTKTSAPDRFEQVTIGVSVSGDTLETADRREIHNLQHEATVQPISSVEPTPPPDVTAITPEKNPGTVGIGKGEKKPVVRNSKPEPKYTEPDKSRPKSANPDKAARMARSKPMVEARPCRPNAFDGLLQALKLSARCQT
ncbi:hypothetical protein [Bradyrhizobium sp. JYMT SZCCT0180]|uniref:hypothetical protein n=1 Tax=Bradyrhizobium sp. JYMT SZCCT0180 TaxID=2807666 RepID=UPI001BADF0F7|nr:hypothetical protein [Bradyrhizobium sp. JYMT SZCCT0180]MBR1215989.1 hypothetical protein [Bradyrhizobium sp. JYMT SZCCT0180]